MGMGGTIAPISEAEAKAEVAEIQAIADRKPSKADCQRYSAQHTRIYSGQHFYLFKFNRDRWRLTTHEFSSSSFSSSNIMKIIENSLKDGTFVGLEEVSIKEYVDAGGSDIPCCLRNCEYEGDWPPCMVNSED